MMTSEREYTFDARSDIKELLDMLLIPDVDEGRYRGAMYALGVVMAKNLLYKLDLSQSYCLASTAEDADFLAKGIIDTLTGKVKKLSLVCFWNYHNTPFQGGESTAPIIKKFIEAGAVEADNLIIVKSIISGSCVVKTNLTSLIQDMTPERIYILAPIMHMNADKKLKQEFPTNITDKFDFQYLAKDQKRDEVTREVLPGIGGNVYALLGFGDQKTKNKYTPQIVQDRLFG